MCLFCLRITWDGNARDGVRVPGILPRVLPGYHGL